MSRFAWRLGAGALSLTALLAAPAMQAAAIEAPEPPAEQPADERPDGRPYPGDPETEPQLVAAEDLRLIDVRAMVSSARWSDVDVSRPYLLATGTLGTLVLVPRSEPYTMQELADTAPTTVTVDAGGAFVLHRHLAVQDGATLLLQEEGGLRLKMVSGERGFTSLVTLGGSLQALGTESAPVEITSFDPEAFRPDAVTDDGRAYLRILGGHASMVHVRVHDLGFWSGETGGLSLTGTELPDEPLVRPVEGELGEAEVPTLAVTPEKSRIAAVTAELSGVHVKGNAYGIFLASSRGIAIDDSTVSDSLVHGIAVHRHVVDSTITDTVSTGNAMDGISVSRSSSDLTFERVTASRNARNGILLNGRPLAEGPNAVGTPVETYGNNSITDSVFEDNGRYGVEIRGGEDIAVTSSRIRGGEMGIVLTTGATDVAILDNEVVRQRSQGIALRDDVTGVVVSGNEVSGGTTGIYVRNADGTITENLVERVDRHGVTLVGHVTGTEVIDNTIAGTGPRPIDTDRAIGAVVEQNRVDGWAVSRTLDVILRSIFQPLTIVWAGVIALVAAALVSRRRARRAGIRHPYAGQEPLSSFTRGIVDRSSLNEEKS